jgi:WD40 repeat protein
MSRALPWGNGVMQQGLQHFTPHLLFFLVLALGLCCLSFTDSCAAGDNGERIPPTQWWGEPIWSPDGKYIFVLSPPPERIAISSPGGKTHYVYPLEPRMTATKGVILRATDFSRLTVIDLDLDTVAATGPTLYPKWSADSKFLSLHHLVFPKSLISIYDPQTGKELKRFMPALLPQCSWAPKSALFACDDNGQKLIYDALRHTEVKLWNDGKQSKSAHWMSWSPDATMLAESNLNQAGFSVWSTKTGAVISSTTAGEYVSWLDWSGNSKEVVHGEIANTLEGPSHIVWYDPMLKKVSHEINTAGLSVFAYSPDHKMFSYSNRDKLHIIDGNDLHEISAVQGPRSGHVDTCWSPDSRYILVSTRLDGTVTVCEAATGKVLGYKAFDNLEKVYWTPDGKTIVAAMRDCPPVLLPFKQSAAGKSAPPFAGAAAGSPGWEIHAAPKNLEECFSALDAELPAFGLQRFIDTPENELYRFGGGSTIMDALICDVYGKWDRTDLTSYFTKLGVSDSRDIDGIIIKSYWRKLHGKPLQVDEQVRQAKGWWIQNKYFSIPGSPASEK